MALPEGAVLELGQRVQFVRPLLRRTDPDRNGRYSERAWVPSEFDTTVHEGIVVGKRVLANGSAYWSEDGWELDFRDRFTAYLIVEDLRSKPRRVLPEHITLLPVGPEPDPNEGTIL